MRYCPQCGTETAPNRSHHQQRFRECRSCGARTEFDLPHQCECGQPKPRRAAACVRCMKLDEDRISGETRRRVLVKLAHLGEWSTAQDVYLALEVAGEVDCRPYGAMLRRLVHEGLAEARNESTATEYRLVQRKRRAA